MSSNRQSRCKHCKNEIWLVNFSLGEQWMHVDSQAGFPSTGKGTLWEFCKLQVAEPED